MNPTSVIEHATAKSIARDVGAPIQIMIFIPAIAAFCTISKLALPDKHAPITFLAIYTGYKLKLH